MLSGLTASFDSVLLAESLLAPLGLGRCPVSGVMIGPPAAMRALLSKPARCINTTRYTRHWRDDPCQTNGRCSCLRYSFASYGRDSAWGRKISPIAETRPQGWSASRNGSLRSKLIWDSSPSLHPRARGRSRRLLGSIAWNSGSAASSRARERSATGPEVPHPCSKAGFELWSAKSPACAASLHLSVCLLGAVGKPGRPKPRAKPPRESWASEPLEKSGR